VHLYGCADEKNRLQVTSYSGSVGMEGTHSAGDYIFAQTNAISRDVSFNTHSFNPVNSGSGASSGPLSYSFETKDQEIVGTVKYMSPESMSGFADRSMRNLHKFPGCTAAADWFSVGAILHEMLTGAVPFRLESDIDSRQVRQMYSEVLVDSEFDVKRAHGAMVGQFKPTEGDKQLMGTDGHSLVDGLMALDSTARMGLNKSCNPSGLPVDIHSELKTHGFFAGVDWVRAESRLLHPPPFSLIPVAFATNNPLSCKEMLESARRSTWVDHALLPAIPQQTATEQSPVSVSRSSSTALTIPMDTQHCFSDWHYVRQDILALERSHGSVL